MPDGWPAIVTNHAAEWRAAPGALQLVDVLLDPYRYIAVLDLDGFREMLLPMLRHAPLLALECAGFEIDATRASGRLVRDEYAIEFGGNADGPRVLRWHQAGEDRGRLWVDGHELPAGASAPVAWAPAVSATQARSRLEQGLLRWPADVWKRRADYRAAPGDLLLLDALKQDTRYLALIGMDGYRELVLPRLFNASLHAVRAAEFKGDRQSEGSAWIVRDGHQIHLDDAPGASHRALFWQQGAHDRLWVDAREVLSRDNAPFGALDSGGYWADDHTFVVCTEGPADHPRQDLRFGSNLGAIVGLLAIDARSGRYEVMQPTSGEDWTWPLLRIADGRWHVYRDLAAVEAGEPPQRVFAAPF